MASRAHGSCAQKIRRAGGARRISPTSFEAGGPSQGEVPGRELGNAGNRSPEIRNPGAGGESAEIMIAPASRSEGELVHMARSIRNHFARSLDRPARTKIAATEVTRQAAPTTGEEDRRCAGNARMYILPRRDDVKIRARHAQLYRGKWPTSKRMDRLYEGL